MANNPRKKSTETALAIANAASWCYALVVVFFILSTSTTDNPIGNKPLRLKFSNHPCDEIYVVGEGETLHTISDKCGDPFIVEQNPHIHDPDDVYPGLVIKITPSKPNNL